MAPNPADEVRRYYNKFESRYGYDLVLGGRKHFGYFEEGHSSWDFGSAMLRMEGILAEALELPPDSLVLDAGCGNGFVARSMAENYALNVTGIDLLDFNVERANRLKKQSAHSDRLRFLNMDYSQLEFADESFDGVYTMETLVHAADPERVLRGFRRVMRPHGRLAMMEYSKDPDSSMSHSAAEAYRYVNQVAAMPGFQQFEHGVLEDLMARVGFADIKVRDLTSQMLPMLRAFSLMGHIPYRVARLLGRPDKTINAMSAVEFWRYRKHFRYSLYTAIRAD